MPLLSWSPTLSLQTFLCMCQPSLPKWFHIRAFLAFGGRHVDMRCHIEFGRDSSEFTYLGRLGTARVFGVHHGQAIFLHFAVGGARFVEIVSFILMARLSGIAMAFISLQSHTAKSLSGNLLLSQASKSLVLGAPVLPHPHS